jgi:hypothetical protein
MSENFAFMGGVVHSDGAVSMGSDARLYVEFYAHSEHQPWKSAEQGRPIYEKKDYIKIIQPGERDQMVREVTDLDKMRFPKQWQAYENQQAQIPDGTPLAVMFPQDPQICDQFRALKIHVVEHLAGLGEEGIKRLGMGGRDHVERAKNFLAAASNMKGAHEMQRQIEAQKDEIATLKAALEQVQKELAANPKRRRAAQEED